MKRIINIPINKGSQIKNYVTKRIERPSKRKFQGSIITDRERSKLENKRPKTPGRTNLKKWEQKRTPQCATHRRIHQKYFNTQQKQRSTKKRLKPTTGHQELDDLR